MLQWSHDWPDQCVCVSVCVNTFVPLLPEQPCSPWGPLGPGNPRSPCVWNSWVFFLFLFHQVKVGTFWNSQPRPPLQGILGIPSDPSHPVNKNIKYSISVSSPTCQHVSELIYRPDQWPLLTFDPGCPRDPWTPSCPEHLHMTLQHSLFDTASCRRMRFINLKFKHILFLFQDKSLWLSWRSTAAFQFWRFSFSNKKNKNKQKVPIFPSSSSSVSGLQYVDALRQERELSLCGDENQFNTVWPPALRERPQVFSKQLT